MQGQARRQTQTGTWESLGLREKQENTWDCLWEQGSRNFICNGPFVTSLPAGSRDVSPQDLPLCKEDQYYKFVLVLINNINDVLYLNY